jgi:ankyrin repeat protein
MRRDKNCVEKLLQNGEDANGVTTNDKLSPLHIAAFIGDADITQVSLDAGADTKAVSFFGADLFLMITKCINESVGEEKKFLREILRNNFML